jgi:hypothetical protein
MAVTVVTTSSQCSGVRSARLKVSGWFSSITAQIDEG